MDDRHTAPELRRENDVIDLLIRQHGMIIDLFGEVERSAGQERAEAFQRLVRLMAVHETAEEEVVHPYVRLKLKDGGPVVDRRLGEEKESKILLKRMEKLGTGHPEFLRDLRALRTMVLAHAQAEERDEFTQLNAHTNAAERLAMAVGVRAAEALAPTHPHPGVESAVKNLLLGPPTALIDRARDVIRKAMGKKS